ncbi:hypothetical protein [Streptomyces virginiae]|uniref:hypothetical protein n=1 Tax=Streptomyces virginiae TaxID=1961 RepID=UPI00386A58B4|nr:hypothetical protein OG253_40610 [Streptomyces virginiae]
MLERALRKNSVKVTFVLPADTPPGEVSVVGDFNDWRPGVHPVTPRKDGNRAVTVETSRRRAGQNHGRPGQQRDGTCPSGRTTPRDTGRPGASRGTARGERLCI